MVVMVVLQIQTKIQIQVVEQKMLHFLVTVVKMVQIQYSVHHLLMQ